MRISLVKWHVGALAVLALSSGLGTLPALAADKLKVGDPFPDLAQYQLEGPLPEPWKGKVVLVDFWASWCGPCKASFPVMEELFNQYGKDGLLIIAVNLDDKREKMDAFLKEHPVSFLTVRDATKKLVGAVNIKSMPSSFILDRDGRIVALHNGFHGEETKKQYVQQLEALLKPKTAKD